MTQHGVLERRRAAEPLTPDSARGHVAAGALTAEPVGLVGLELEGHLVDLHAPSRRPAWDRLTTALDQLPELPARSAVSVEPGGQVELSTPPGADAATAVAGLRADGRALRAHLHTLGLGLAHVGADPARPVRRVNPGPRYRAMERYFVATGNGRPGRSMMCATAALQVNLQAGPEAGWASRVALAHRLGPVLIAVAACSPALAGQRSGWRCMRQQVWGELDQARCGPLLGSGDPAGEWAEYALAAPVMLVADAGGVVAQDRGVAFRDWVSGKEPLRDRRPDRSDLDLHLTTLFPPVRLRGFLELRYLDAVPSRFWPGLAASAALLLDDPRAADAAAEATEPLRGAWTVAARDGLADPALRRAARTCLAAAEAAAPATLRPAVAALAELVEAGRCPGDEFAEALTRGPAEDVLRRLADPAEEG